MRVLGSENKKGHSRTNHCALNKSVLKNDHLLSLTIGDVYQNRAAVTDLLFDWSIVKGGEVSRAAPVNIGGTQGIEEAALNGKLAIHSLIPFFRWGTQVYSRRNTIFRARTSRV